MGIRVTVKHFVSSYHNCTMSFTCLIPSVAIDVQYLKTMSVSFLRLDHWLSPQGSDLPKPSLNSIHTHSATVRFISVIFHVGHLISLIHLCFIMFL